MPDFDVTHPVTGQTITISGPHPPTDADIQEVFNQVSGHGTHPTMGAFGGDIPHPPVNHYEGGGGFRGNNTKSVGGFLANTATSAGQTIVDTAKGLFDLGMAPSRLAYGLATDPKGMINSAKTALDPKTLTTNLKNTASAVGQYEKDRYWNHLGDTLYNDPVGVASDVSLFTPFAEAGMTKLGVPAKVAKVAELANVPKVATSAAVKGAEMAKAPFSMFGAEGRNEKYLGRLANPGGFSTDEIATAPHRMQAELNAGRGETFNTLLDTKQDLLGTKAKPTNLSSAQQPKKVTQKARYKPPIDKNDRLKSLKYQDDPYFGRDVTMTMEHVEPGQKFGDMAKLRSEMIKRLPPGHPAILALEADMRKAAEYAGTPIEANAFFNNSKDIGQAYNVYDNPLVKQVATQTAAEDIPKIFERGGMKTGQPRFSTNAGMRAGVEATPYSNAENVKTLKGAVKPKTFEQFKANQTGRAVEGARNADRSINPQALKKSMEHFRNAGVDEELINNNETFKDLAEALAKHDKDALILSSEGKGIVRDVIRNLARKVNASAPDYERLVNKLRAKRTPLSSRLLDALTKNNVVTKISNPAAVGERVKSGLKPPPQEKPDAQ